MKKIEDYFIACRPYLFGKSIWSKDLKIFNQSILLSKAESNIQGWHCDFAAPTWDNYFAMYKKYGITSLSSLSFPQGGFLSLLPGDVRKSRSCLIDEASWYRTNYKYQKTKISNNLEMMIKLKNKGHNPVKLKKYFLTKFLWPVH